MAISQARENGSNPRLWEKFQGSKALFRDAVACNNTHFWNADQPIKVVEELKHQHEKQVNQINDILSAPGKMLTEIQNAASDGQIASLTAYVQDRVSRREAELIRVDRIMPLLSRFYLYGEYQKSALSIRKSSPGDESLA